jgi:hypothetical protein
MRKPEGKLAFDDSGPIRHTSVEKSVYLLVLYDLSIDKGSLDYVNKSLRLRNIQA